MEEQGLILLQYGGQTVELKLFASPPNPTPSRGGTIDYSYGGAAVVTLPAHEPKLTWVISAYVSTEDKDFIDYMVRDSQNKQQTAPYTGWEITLGDQSQTYSEASPRTRTRVGDYEEAIGETGWVKYHRAYLVRIDFNTYTLQETGNSNYNWLVNFTANQV